MVIGELRGPLARVFGDRPIEERGDSVRGPGRSCDRGRRPPRFPLALVSSRNHASRPVAEGVVALPSKATAAASSTTSRRSRRARMMSLKRSRSTASVVTAFTAGVGQAPVLPMGGTGLEAGSSAPPAELRRGLRAADGCGRRLRFRRAQVLRRQAGYCLPDRARHSRSFMAAGSASRWALGPAPFNWRATSRRLMARSTKRRTSVGPAEQFAPALHSGATSSGLMAFCAKRARERRSPSCGVAPTDFHGLGVAFEIEGPE